MKLQESGENYVGHFILERQNGVMHSVELARQVYEKYQLFKKLPVTACVGLKTTEEERLYLQTRVQSFSMQRMILPAAPISAHTDRYSVY